MNRPGIAALLAVVMLAAACGSPSGDDASPTAASTIEPSSTTSTLAPTSVATSTTIRPTPSVDDDRKAGTTSTSLGAPESTPTTAAPGPDAPLPTDAKALGAALVLAEAAIRDQAISDSEAAAWGRNQQRLYLHLSRHQDWVNEALAIDDPVLRRAAESNWEARVNLDALVSSEEVHTNVPAWRVVAPRPIEELLGYYRAGEAEWGIDWTYLAAINLVETRMGRIEGISTAGAVGPMQFLLTTWAECCDGDPTDPADAIPGAARYLTIRGGPDDMDRAIWGYNNSDRYVAAVQAYASILREDELAYRGYHAWEIYFRSSEGLLHLPVGYEETEAVPAAEWLERHPEQLLP